MRFYRPSVLICWFLALVTALAFNLPSIPGWDVDIYTSALRSARSGNDPYVASMAVQQSFRDHGGTAITPGRPSGYIYPPVTVPALKLIGRYSNPRFVRGFYWILIFMSSLAIIGVGMQAVLPVEMRVFSYIAPAASFFPALIQNDTLYSGNVAFILYGAVLVCALIGWRRSKWLPYYTVVLAASCLKLPMLTLLALPILSARKQWVSAAVVGILSIAFFGAQWVIWPNIFHHFMQAVNMQLEYNLDFGAAPEGILSRLLMESGKQYRLAAAVTYIVYAACDLAVLMTFSRRFVEGELEFARWMPVTILGVFLLNPRILEYDLFPVTIPMALIAWRCCTKWMGRLRGPVVITSSVLVANLFGGSNFDRWKPTAGVLAVICFCMGSWQLQRQSAGALAPPSGIV